MLGRGGGCWKVESARVQREGALEPAGGGGDGERSGEGGGAYTLGRYRASRR